jgi:hypothetical protein
LVRNAIALWRPHYSGRAFHRLRFFSIGNRHCDGSRRDRMAVAAFLGDSTRAMLLRAFVPLITAAPLINGWINARLPARIHGSAAHRLSFLV